MLKTRLNFDIIYVKILENLKKSIKLQELTIFY